MEWLLYKLAPFIQDEFSKGRAASLGRAANKADAGGVRNCDDFLAMLFDYTEQGRSAPQAVQVMTIHKSKGLEYDMVVLPIPPKHTVLDSLKNKTLDLWQNKDGESFLMKLPAEEIRNVSGNETLDAAATMKKSELAFEELCVWYVAMSRAKQALYLFTPPPKEISKDKCPTFPQLLAAGLNNLPEFQNPSPEDFQAALGDPRWFEKFVPLTLEPSSAHPPESIMLSPRPPTLTKSLPSHAGEQILLGSRTFSDQNATQLGSEVHSFFESLSWMDKNTAPDFSTLSCEAREFLKPCLENLVMDQFFQKPEGETLLWREQRFDLILQNEWVSGCFDRAVIFLDAQRKPTGADLLDFKTDQGSREQLLATHRPQLELYRKALSRLLDLSEKKIRMILIHVRSSEPVVLLK